MVKTILNDLLASSSDCGGGEVRVGDSLVASRLTSSSTSSASRIAPSQRSSPRTQKTRNGVAPNNWWYSWDDGLVHYVAISTEVYFGVPGVGASGPIGSVKKQFEWLKADLRAANANRDNVPWIVVHGHRSVYCSCDDDCDGAAKTLHNAHKAVRFDLAS